MHVQPIADLCYSSRLFGALLCSITPSAGERWEETGANLDRSGGELQKPHVHAECPPPPSQPVHCLSGNILNLVHFTYVWRRRTHRQRCRQRLNAGTHTHIQMRPRLLSLAALKALGTACLPFTVTAAHVCMFVCVCVRLCVDLRKEILRVKCSPGLNYHF